MLSMLESFLADGTRHALEDDRRIRFSLATSPVTHILGEWFRHRGRWNDGRHHGRLTPGLPCFQAQVDSIHHPPQGGPRCFGAGASHVGGHDCTPCGADTDREHVGEQARNRPAFSFCSKWLSQFVPSQNVEQLLVRRWCACPLLQAHCGNRCACHRRKGEWWQHLPSMLVAVLGRVRQFIGADLWLSSRFGRAASPA